MHSYCVQEGAANNSIWLLPSSKKRELHAKVVSLKKQDITVYSTEPGSFYDIINEM
jgi:hypothetical protein